MERLCALLMILFVSCGKNSAQKQIEMDTIPTIDLVNGLNNSQNSNFNLTEVASSIDFVKLEETPNSMIRDIRTVSVGDKYILVQDYSEGAFLFSKEGKFLNKIGKKGQGPKEYIYMTQAILNEKGNNVYIYTNRGIKVYGINGEHQRNIPKTTVEDLFYGLENKILYWDDKWFLNDKLPVMNNKIDLSTFTLVDSNFVVKKGFRNPSFAGMDSEIIKNGQPHIGWKNAWIEYFAPIDFYNNEFKMSYYDGDTIYKYDSMKEQLLPYYVLSLGKRPSFEMSHQHYKSSEFFKYLWLYDFYDSKDYVYFVLGKSDYLYYLRYEKSNGNIKTVKKENRINEKHFEGAPANFVVRRRNTDFIVENDLSGGIPFVVEYKSMDGKYWIDEMQPSELLETNLFELKDKLVKDEHGKIKLQKLIKDLKEDDNPILAIATLK